MTSYQIKNELTNSKSANLVGLFAEENMPLQIDAPKKNPMLADKIKCIK